MTTPYPTLDFLPDLTPTEMARAARLTFKPYVPVTNPDLTGWDNEAVYSSIEPYAILRDTFVWTATAGATYDIASHSFFDPFLIQVYDQYGNVIAVDGNGIDPYGADFVWDFRAPYSGTYYVSAGWDQGSAPSHRFVMLAIYEDADTAPDPATDGTAGNDTLPGTPNLDAMFGYAGDDLMHGGGSNDSLDGGPGFDTAIYDGPLSRYTVAPQLLSYRVTDNTGAEGRDQLTNIERIQFSDLRVDLTIAGKAAAASPADLKSAIELYIAFFDRMPDSEGLGFWLDQMKGGLSLNAMAESFYAAAVQYADLTGYSPGMSDADFVGTIYRNVLGRETVDSDGLLYWTSALASGSETRGSLVSSILTSAHSFKGDAQWGWVADLLDNKYEVGYTLAVAMGISFNTPEESISRGMAIAEAVTPTDIGAAIELIGADPAAVSLI